MSATRPLLADPQPGALEKMVAFHPDIVGEVADAVAAHPVVVVGMSLNPHVPQARRALEAAGIAYEYRGYGGYFSMWKQRLAIKMWSGWPTYPQVFVGGRLLGGADETVTAIESGELARLLAQG